MRYEWPVEKKIRAERANKVLAALRRMEEQAPAYEAAFIAARKAGMTCEQAAAHAESVVA